VPVTGNVAETGTVLVAVGIRLGVALGMPVGVMISSVR
jgi:hypothetical protein